MACRFVGQSARRNRFPCDRVAGGSASAAPRIEEMPEINNTIWESGKPPPWLVVAAPSSALSFLAAYCMWGKPLKFKRPVQPVHYHYRREYNEVMSPRFAASGPARAFPAFSQ
eukprot:TRINITY_DN4154_c0_g4_i2.p2 TRINITY_DN4154_c0_g4~~TRINITY_DN4154_c0_g4_i2.p2  ORF type:complete len:113 (+),score=17.25 TRINITY_DN4154_c0_g4_i2:1-339(+)